MNRVDRLVATLLLLQSRSVVRAKDIADHFGISTRTVYRDINALCEAGVPIAAEAGEGYSIVAGYHLPPVMFTREEVSALLVGVKFVEKHTDKSLREHAKSAMLKIQSILPDESRKYIEGLKQSTVMPTWSRRRSDTARDDVLVTIQHAVVNRKLLKIAYHAQSRDSLSQREVEPLGLLYYADAWHLIAYCRLRQDYRDFRTDRIRAIALRDASFEPRQGFSLAEYLSQAGKLENPVRIRVKFSRKVAAHVREKSFGLIDEQALEDGVAMTFLVENLHWAAHWLLSYGSLAQVLSPNSLRKLVLEETTKIAAIYDVPELKQDC